MSRIFPNSKPKSPGEINIDHLHEVAELVREAIAADKTVYLSLDFDDTMLLTAPNGTSRTNNHLEDALAFIYSQLEKPVDAEKIILMITSTRIPDALRSKYWDKTKRIDYVLKPFLINVASKLSPEIRLFIKIDEKNIHCFNGHNYIFFRDPQKWTVVDYHHYAILSHNDVIELYEKTIRPRKMELLKKHNDITISRTITYNQDYDKGKFFCDRFENNENMLLIHFDDQDGQIESVHESLLWQKKIAYAVPVYPSRYTRKNSIRAKDELTPETVKTSLHAVSTPPIITRSRSYASHLFANNPRRPAYPTVSQEPRYTNLFSTGTPETRTPATPMQSQAKTPDTLAQQSEQEKILERRQRLIEKRRLFIGTRRKKPLPPLPNIDSTTPSAPR